MRQDLIVFEPHAALLNFKWKKEEGVTVRLVESQLFKVGADVLLLHAPEFKMKMN